MNGSSTIQGVSAVPPKGRRRRRGFRSPGLTPVGAEDMLRHQQLMDDPALKSGRCGAFDYFVRNGRQSYRRHATPRDPRTPAQQLARATFGAASKGWSQALTELDRAAWRAGAAKILSRPRLSLSGPLTGQQYYVGRSSATQGPPSRTVPPGPAGANLSK